MIRICVVGNSHVAAMRLAWNKVSAEYPQYEVSIYGGRARDLVTATTDTAKALNFEGSRLWSFESGSEPGRTHTVPLEGADAVIIVGCGFGSPCIFRTYKRYHFAGLKGRRRRALTRDYFKRAVAEEVTASAAGILAQAIQPAIDAPVFLVPTPLPAESGFEDMDKLKLEPYRAAREAGDGEALMAVFDEVCADLAAKRLAVIRQPQVTKASAISSLQVYSDNSTRLRSSDDELHPEDDYFHMNTRYGELVWAEIFAAIVARLDV